MTKENLVKYKSFRELCIANSEDALRAAGLLLNKNANHIVFHLCVLALEEIGKIFICFQNLSLDNSPNLENTKIPLDDHIKKLFWAIWGHFFMEEKITQQQLSEIKNVATKLHDRRLEVLYTDLSDTCKLSEKITDKEVTSFISLAKDRLQLSKSEGDIDENYKPSEAMDWFMKTTNISHKRTFIFGEKSQEKLIEFGDVSRWVMWLKEHFETEEKKLNEILDGELKKAKVIDASAVKPKWKMTFTFVSQSHSLRQSVFNSFNESYRFIKLSKGKGNHTLIVEAIFGSNVPITELWGHGITFGKLFVAALNIASNGLFYWNISVDIDKYYDKIWDLENKKELSARLENGFRIKWEDKQLVLLEKHLHLTMIVYEYFNLVYGGKDFEPVNDYIDALGMMAKTDIHLRLEKTSFIKFYESFLYALKNNERIDENTDMKELGYNQIMGMIKGRSEFDKVMDLGKNNVDNIENLMNITLKEVIGIKMYSGIYLMTLALRKLQKDRTLCLTSED
jgi:AbiV family abortive infection protein